MGNPTNLARAALDAGKDWNTFLTDVIGDGTVNDLFGTTKVDQHAGTVSKVPFGQVNKDYLNLLDDIAQVAYESAGRGGFDYKDSVRASTTAALPANTLLNGVLTADANGALAAQDGITLAVGEDLLVKDEGGGTSAKQGIYEVTDLGDAGSPWILTRRADANSSDDVTSMMVVTVSEGSTLGRTAWVISTADPITLDTTPITFVQFGAVTPPLADVLGVGNTTDNQAILGTDAATAVLSALTLAAGQPSGSAEDGGPLSITGGQCSGAGGTPAGGPVTIAGGPGRTGLSTLCGLMTVSGGDATDAIMGGGQAVFRGGDDGQGALTTAGDATFRGGDSTGDRIGSQAIFRGGHCGNHSGQVGGPAILLGGDGGLQGTGGTAIVRGGHKQGGTGGYTGPVLIETQDFTPGEYTGTGAITIRTGNSDHAGSNHVGSISIYCGKSGTGSGNPGNISITAGEDEGTDNAGSVSITGGEQSGNNAYDGGPVNITGGPATAGNADGGSVVLTGGAGSGSGVDGDISFVGPTGGTSTFNGQTGQWTLHAKVLVGGELEIDGNLNHDGSNCGLYGVAPVARPAALTAALTQISHTGPTTPDYAIATPINTNAWGFSTQDEFETVMSVILNLQTRVDEAETKLQSLGLLQ